MSALVEILSGVQGEMARAAEISASALVAGLWQSALLVAAMGLVLKMVPRTTAAVRFAIWTAVFCVSMVMPLAGILFGNRVVSSSGAAGHLRVDAEWSYLIAVVWVLSSVARLVQLGIQGWKLRGLWQRSVPVAEDALALMGCGDLPNRRTVRVCTSEDVDRPSVIGFFAPRILIPAWLFEQLSATELRHIVLHEMEHLRRRDDWMNLLQKVGLVVFPLNPALFWVDRRLATERELACDDGVLQRTQMRRAYATCLASIAEMRLERKMHRRVVALALGVLGAAGILRGRSELGRRIESILNRRAAVNPLIARGIAAVLVAGGLGAGVGLAHAPQLVSFAPVSRASGLASSSGQVVPSSLIDGSVARTGTRVQEVSFHLSSAKETIAPPIGLKTVPQRLKPHSKGGIYGTAEAVPLSKAGVADGGDDVAVLDRSKIQTIRFEAAKSQTSQAKEQWLVMTSFEEGQGEEDAPARVVVRFEDGRFYVVTIVRHAAVPVRDGWLIVQL